MPAPLSSKPAPGNKRRKAYRFGLAAEWMGAGWLVLKGYQILALRHRNPFGEIDIVARRGSVLCFIEVKARPRAEASIEAVTSLKQQRLIRAAQAFYGSSPKFAGLDMRFDLIIVTPWHRPHHIQDAWRA